MLGPIRKFSSTITAKIFLFIVAIPFIFWGMGDVFTSGNLNTIVKIGNKKVSTQDFIQYIQNNAPSNQVLNDNIIDRLLSNFIGEKLIFEEVDYFKIGLSDKSLSKLIKNEKVFMKDGKFSRTEYEKFLVQNNQTAPYFENNLSKRNRRNQLFNLIGGGIVPSNFIINLNYNKVNQKRDVELLDLNEVYKDQFIFTEEQILENYNLNKELHKEIFKTVKFVELNSKTLTGNEEISDLFFQKIDEIDDLIVANKKLNQISEKFNLTGIKKSTVNNKGINKINKKDKSFPADLVDDLFKLKDNEMSTLLIELKDKFFIIELTKTETINKEVTDTSVRKEIIIRLKNDVKKKLFNDLIAKINQNNFTKNDFDKLSVKKKIKIKKIKLKSQKDNNLLKDEIINQIYSFPQNKVIMVHDLTFNENYLIYVDKIENVEIKEDSKEYEEYLKISKKILTSNLYNTYDTYLRNKYEVEINYNALSNVKNNIK